KLRPGHRHRPPRIRILLDRNAMTIVPRPLALAALPLLVALFGQPAASAAAPLRTDAPSLVRIARGALSRVRSAAAADPRFAANPTHTAPFWSALQTTGQALAEVEAGLSHPAPDLFRAIGDASRRVAELSAAWSRTGIDHGGIRSELGTLGTAWGVFRGTYGPEGVRHRSGEALSAEEARRLESIRRGEERLARRLAALEAQAKKGRDAGEARRLAALRRRAEDLASEVADLDGYLASLSAVAELQGEWRAAKAAASPKRRAAYGAVDPLVDQIAADSEAGSVFVVDVAKGETWNFLEQPTELPPDLAGTPEALAAAAEAAETGETGSAEEAESTAASDRDSTVDEESDSEKAQASEPAEKSEEKSEAGKPAAGTPEAKDHTAATGATSSTTSASAP